MAANPRWYRRVALLVSTMLGAGTALLMPAVAWAHTNPTAVVVLDELAKKRKSRSRGGFGLISGFGIAGTLCCLLVVAAVILGFVLYSRRKKG